MSTILAFERHPVQPGREDEYRGLLEVLLREMRQAGGALWADAAAALDDRPSYLVVSEWRSSADLDAWESGERREGFDSGADPLLREAPTRRRFSAPS